MLLTGANCFHPLAIVWADEQRTRPNVLLIMADDLRPQLGCYGDSLVKTPRLDAFARRAMRFDRAYVQCAICSPSRNSLLSGLRPATTQLWGFGKTIREARPEIITLPQHFKQHGYHTAAIGKVFHVYAETGLGSEDDPASWSEPLYLPKNPVWGPEQEAERQTRVAADRLAGKEYKHSRDVPRGETWDAPDVPDDALRDGESATRAIEFLNSRATKRDEPFFLAVGFYSPHLPFVAPKKYFDLYEERAMMLPSFQTAPHHAPAGTFNPGYVSEYVRFPPVEQRDEAFARKYLRAYLACISYADACAGRVLDALAKNGLEQNTIVVVLGDHGYLMGEYGSWGHKHCNYEIATRAPLLIAAPKERGGSSSAIVEFLDIYPTLCQLARLPIPEHCEGRGLQSVLAGGEATRQWAISEMWRGEKYGRAIRTNDMRYVEWTSKLGFVVARELYDHRSDPNETENLSDSPDFAEVRTRLSRLLNEQLPLAGR